MQFFLEPKTVPSTLVNADAFAGMTKKKRKRKQLSGTKGEAKGKYKMVSFCPECCRTAKSGGELQNVYPTAVSGTQRYANCKQGHTWEVNPPSIAGEVVATAAA